MKKGDVKGLYTRWGREIDKDAPWGEYPRPQLRREGWQSLNGRWAYAFVKGAPGPEPARFEGEITVPYPPESLLSGLERQLLPGDTLWYRRVFTYVPKKGQRALLHFGAVDQCCAVFVNGQEVGRHEGGYLPFAFDITESIVEGENSLSLWVTDDIEGGPHAYGKQKLKRGGIWYTATSGIWQTVWLEQVPQSYIERLKITPRYERGAVEVEIYTGGAAFSGEVAITVLDGRRQVAVYRGSDRRVRLPMGSFKSWSPASPFLYDLVVTLGQDRVESYFGMRSFAPVRDEKGRKRLGLNGEPVFHTGLLDQGYWSDGIVTPPSDEAMVWELEQVKRMGFNMLRKHIKIEPLRWYYHCDRLGILVWQDLVNGGRTPDPVVVQALPFVGVKLDDTKHKRFGREDAAGRVQFEKDMACTVDALYNVASLCLWVPFNEGWGQFDSTRIAGVLAALDPTRPIDAVSGWHDQGAGDVHSPHVYFKPFRLKRDKRGRVEVLSEFGGYSCPAEGHMATGKLFGYRMYKDAKAFSRAYEELYRKEILPYVDDGLSAAVYTQVSDVEDEINGLFTYDREVVKLEEATARRVNQLLTER